MSELKLGLEARTRMLSLLSERKDRILMALTSEYKGGTMTPDKAMGFVGEISCVMGLIGRVTEEGKEERRRS